MRLMPAKYKHGGCKEHFSKPHGADHSQHLLIQFAMTNPNVFLLRLLKILAPPLRASLLRVDNARLAAPQPAAAAKQRLASRGCWAPPDLLRAPTQVCTLPEAFLEK